MANIGTLTVVLGADLTALNASLAKANSSLQRFGYVATTSLTLPITMAGKAAFQMAKDFEYAIQKIVGLTGVAQTTVNAWEKDILKMGPELGQMPQKLADALYFISSSGIKGAEAINVLELSAKAATAGLGEVKDVANVLTSALNAYAGTGLTAAYATDVIVAAVREGKAEAEGFSNALGQIIPIAANLGVSFDQVAGGMAAITLTGASSANAAVYLKAIFTSLVTASEQGEKALAKAQTSYAELRSILANQGLIALLQKMRDIQMQYGDEILGDFIPNVRSMTGFLSLAGKNFKYNSELIERVTASTDSLNKAYAAVSNTIKVRFDKALSSAQSAMISLGKTVAEALLPVFEKIVNGLMGLAKWFNELNDTQKKITYSIIATAAALGPLSLLFSSFVWILRGLNSVLATSIERFTQLSAVIVRHPYIALGVAITTIAVAVYKWKTAATDLQKVQSSVSQGVGKEIFSLNSLFTKIKNTTEGTKERAEAIKIANDRYGSYLTNLLKEKSSLEDITKAQKEATNALVASISIKAYQSKIEEMSSDIAKSFDNQLTNFLSVFQKMKGSDRLSEFVTALYEGADEEIRQGGGKVEKGVLQWSNVALKIYNEFIKDISAQTGYVKYSFQDFQEAFLSFAQVKGEKNLVIEQLNAMIEGFKKINPAIEETTKTNNGLNNSLIKTENFYKLILDQYKAYLDALNEEKEVKFDEPIDFQKFFMRTRTTTSPLTELNKEMELLALKNKVLGESFNTTRQQIQYFQSVLNELWDQGMRPGLEGSELMDQVIGRIKELTKQQYAVDLMTEAFTNFFMITKEGFKNFDEFLRNWVNSILQSFQRLIAELLAKKIATALASIMFPGSGGGTGIVGTILGGITGKNMLFNLTGGGTGYASGGIVPPGYPNDTYPARLSSGEVVLPKGFANMIMQPQYAFEDVKFVIEDNVLTGILKKSDTRKSIY